MGFAVQKMLNKVSILIDKCHTVNCLLLSLFCLWLGQWVKKQLVVLDDGVLLVLRESPYLSFSVPLWVVNSIVGFLLLSTLFLIVPVLWRRWVPFTVFAALLLLSTLPLHAHINSVHFNSDAHVFFSCYLIISSIGVILCFRGLVGMRLRRLHKLLSRFFRLMHAIRPGMFLLSLSVICFLACSFISWRVFDGVPRFIDSCAYMFQARLFAHGSLFAPIPPEPDFFTAPNVLMTEKWYSQYPPGYPALLALGVLLGIPWVVNPLLGVLTIVCIYLLAKELYGDSVAKLSAVLACASSFFLFMSSEFVSHPSTLFFVTLAFLSFVWIVKKKRPCLSAVVCGTSLGIALLCRPYTTVWICVPLGIAAIVAWKKLSLRHILIGAIPLLGACFVFLAYNYATTGDPLLFGYIALYGKGHYPGFHLYPDGEQFHTIWQGFKHLFGNLNALNYYLFEWPMPSLFFVCFFLGFGKKSPWGWLLVGWIGSLLVGYFFYFFNELAFGPRFVYETLPALILLTSQGLVLSSRFLASCRKSLSYAHARNVLFLALTGLFLFGFVFNLPVTAKTYRSYGKDIIVQKYLNKAEVVHALVFVKDVKMYWVHYPFNAPFAASHIYAKDRGSENRRLAEKFPGYRYFIADEKEIVEVSIDEL